MHAGTLAVGGMNLTGLYTQSGGSTYVSGDLKLQSTISRGTCLRLTGGVLTENNLTIDHRGLIQQGGLHTVKSNLTVYGWGTDAVPYGGYEVDLTGGQILVSNILLRAANMTLAAGTLVQSGTITLANGKLLPGTGNHEFGVLKLDTNDIATNSSVVLPASAACVVRFRSSWNLTWTKQATLTITNWLGSPYGNGTHQIIFGTNRLGATPIQLSQIRFQNPLGLHGSFPSRILPTGEIVPSLLLQERHRGSQLLLEWDREFVLQSAPTPAGPYTDVSPAASIPFAIDRDLPQQFFRLRQLPR